MKDSFVLYSIFYEPIKYLSDRQLGRLLRAIFEYNISGSESVEDDIKMAFLFFKNQMDIDEKKYQKVIERNRLNGANGGRPKKDDKNPKNPVGFKKPKKADNDNDNDSKENNKEKNAATAATPSNLEKRSKELYDTLIQFVGKYPATMIRAFYDYWTEPNRTGTKMRFEMEKTFEVSRRLNTWAGRDKNFKHEENETNKEPRCVSAYD